MKKSRLERRIIEEYTVCDYCDIPIKVGSDVFVKIYFDVDGFNEIILCSPNCLDNYEAEEFMNKFNRDYNEDFERGFHETPEDYFGYFEEEE